MPIRERRNKRWYFRTVIRLPDGSRCRIFGVPGEFGLPNTKSAAKEAEQRKVRMVLMGWDPRPQEPSRTETVAAFQSVFLEAADAANKYSTTKAKRQVLRDHIVPALGHLDLADVTYAVVEDFKHSLLQPPKNLAPKTANNVLTTLRRMLNIAVKRGVIAAAPPVEWLKVDQDDFDFLTFDEAAALEDAADELFRPMIVMALRTGMRQGELLGLRWSDVDLKAGRIVVRHAFVHGRSTSPKSRKPREIPIADDLRIVLPTHRRELGAYVFCDAKGKHLTPGACKWPLYHACEAAGLRRIGWHVLRHTFASHLVMRGVPIKYVQELMGHSTIQMTMRYAHLSPETKRDAILVLDRGATFGAMTGLKPREKRSTRGKTAGENH